LIAKESILIKDIVLAKEINQLMRDCSAKLDQSIASVQDQCSLEEFEAYRLSAGRVMGYIFTDISIPLYEMHPELKPEGL
jgi:hypothetical protein